MGAPGRFGHGLCDLRLGDRRDHRAIAGYQSVEEFAAAQAGDGYPGTVEQVGGIDAFIWEPSSDYGGGVRVIVGETKLVVIGNGSSSGQELRAIAASALPSIV